LSFYLRQLDQASAQGLATVSSARLAAALGSTAAQVRKDLNRFGQLGRPGVGYGVEELRRTVRQLLGVDRRWPVAVVGVGNLGRALTRYRGFRERSFDVVALFDADPAILGTTVAGIKVSPLSKVSKVVAERGVRLAILTVPAEAAQGAADALVRAGVAGILNFAPATLRVPAGVALYPADLTVFLEQLSCQVSGVGFAALRNSPKSVRRTAGRGEGRIGVDRGRQSGKIEVFGKG
jgi:redox-sensing transcriptional repressor